MEKKIEAETEAGGLIEVYGDQLVVTPTPMIMILQLAYDCCLICRSLCFTAVQFVVWIWQMGIGFRGPLRSGSRDSNSYQC